MNSRVVGWLDVGGVNPGGAGSWVSIMTLPRRMVEKTRVGFGQIIATSAEVTRNGGLVRESPQNPLNSGLGSILICPGIGYGWLMDTVDA